VSGATKLYTAEVLGLATSLARWPHNSAAPHQGKARSQSCGSTLAVSIATETAGRIEQIGIAAQACAVGQASAAIFAAAALGKTREDLAAAEQALSGWLSDNSAMPDWPGLIPIAPARDYPARHGAILLPWRAALDALSESFRAG
jgi:NifU-like protein involved in Fe-S cluster formation